MVYISEAARERDLYRYFRPWLDAQSLVNAADGEGKGLTYTGYQPQSSRDRSLTAFAQLAALRLDARRAMISLIDSHRQHILAEATRTVSLFSPYVEQKEDEVWLGNAVLNKVDAVCYHTFSSTYNAKEENGETYTAEAMIIPDCLLDDRFAERSYVKDGTVRFYAGVPIITKAGNRIGVYAVSDEKPRSGLCAADLRFMQDVAAAVMEHLELAKDSMDRNKGERMVRGLTKFIEVSSAQDVRDEYSKRPTTIEKQTKNAQRGALDDEKVPATVPIPPMTNREAQRKRDAESDIARIFHRAARIIRQSTEADGVVFFDVRTAGIRGQIHHFNRAAASSDESGTHNTDTYDSPVGSRRRKKQEHSSPDDDAETSVTESRACPVVGLSLREESVSLVHADFMFTEAAVERYIHRYPFGKFFNYNEEGVSMYSADEKSERSENDQTDRTVSPPNARPRKPKRRREKFVPMEFLKLLPHLRTLIFLPLWDPASERWVASGFIWTTQTGRLMSPEHELPYLQAFGNTITSEVARLSAQKADRAKTTFIASISHELRSPLHGILGSVEFLRDTVASAYQESLVSSIETCGRTLLDTIDHVLDYAKINKLRSSTSGRRQRSEGRNKRLPADNSILGVTADFDLAQLVEEVADTVCAGHTFRKTHNIPGSAIYDQAENADIVNAPDQTDKATILEGRDTHGSVIVSLIVAPYVSWSVRSQPGALRRIVMNLLGNALKYTASGFIAIHMSQFNSSTNFIDFSLTVEDSGKGMSKEYQKTKLFSPFSQEDPFSSGTGLGLSIVKQIVESLGGEIEVRSTIQVGTIIKVSIRLPVGQTAKENAVSSASKDLKDAKVSIMFEPDTRGGERGVRTKESLHTACEGFEMKISDDIDADASIADVNFLLTDSPSLDQLIHKPSASRLNRPALLVICICTDITEKTAVEDRLKRPMDALGWVVDFITQPCGPRKLSRVLLQCQQQVKQLANERLLTRSTSSFVVPQHQTLTAPLHALTQRSLSEMSPGKDQERQDANESVGPLSFALRPPSISITPSSPASSSLSESAIPRVLLVDDNAINLKLLVVFAKRHNLPYSEALNGLEALETYNTEALATSPPSCPFDFILMDLSMPVMDGLTSTRQIRQFEAKHGLRKSLIVALTGLASAQDQSDAQEAGVDVYLVKPVRFADIKRIFGVRLNQRPG